MHNEVIKQQPVNFLDLERAYSDFATSFITMAAKNKRPFFLYYPSHVGNSFIICQEIEERNLLSDIFVIWIYDFMMPCT